MKQEFQDLVALTKQYISQEYKNEDHGQTKKEWVTSELDTYTYFKEYAGQLKKTENPHQTLPVTKEIQQKKEAPIPTATLKTHSQLILEEPLKKLEIPKVVENTVSNEPLQKKQFLLEPLVKVTKEDLTDIQKMVTNLLPRQIILDTIVTDEPVILIISDHKEKKESTFLENLTKALSMTVGLTKLIRGKKFHEKKPFSNLKMIIQTNETEEFKLDGVHYLEFTNLSDLFKDPQKKAALWNQLKTALTNS